MLDELIGVVAAAGAQVGVDQVRQPQHVAGERLGAHGLVQLDRLVDAARRGGEQPERVVRVERRQRHVAALAEHDRALGGVHGGRLVAVPGMHHGEHPERDHERRVLARLVGERDRLLGVGERAPIAAEGEVALGARGERVGEGADRGRLAARAHEAVEQLHAALVLLDPQPAVGGERHHFGRERQRRREVQAPLALLEQAAAGGDVGHGDARGAGREHGERRQQLGVAGELDRALGVGEPAAVVAQRHRPERGEQEQQCRGRRRIRLEPARLGAQELARLLGAPGAQRELRSQRPQLGGHGSHIRALGDGEHALRLLEPGEADVRVPRGKQVARGLDQPARSLERRGGELGRAQVRVGGRPEAGARPCRPGGGLERGRDGLVGPRRAGGELPGALRVVLRQGCGNGAMRGAARHDAGAVIGGGAQERMPERHLAGGERDDPGALCVLQRRRVEAGRAQRTEHDVAAARLGRGRDQQRAARIVGQPVEPAREHALERRAGRQRPFDRGASFELVTAQQRGYLQQRERVAAGRVEHAAGHELGHRVVASRLQQLERALRRQRPGLELLEPGRHVSVGSVSQQHGDAVGPEPARGEAQRLERRLVEPLHLVGHAQHRPLLGREREQAEQRGADRQPGLRRRRLELQRARERRRLSGRQPVAQREHRLAQLRQARERQAAPRPRARACAARSCRRRARSRRPAAPSCRSRAGRGPRARRCRPLERCSSARSTRSSSASRPISTSGRVSQAPPAPSLGLSVRQTEIP